MDCSACGSSLPEGATFCPACGAAATGAAAAGAPLPSDIRALLTEVARLHGEGHLEEAVNLCVRFIAVDPKSQQNAQAYEALGDLYQEMDNGAGAMDAYRRAVYLLPTETNRRKYDELLDRLHGRAEEDAPAEEIAEPIAAPTTPGAAVASPTRPPTRLSLPDEEEDQRPDWMKYLLAPERAKLVISAAAVIIILSLLLTFHPWQRPKKAAPFKYSIPGRTVQPVQPVLPIQPSLPK
ncbi:MAG: tetratricopeptide repeat protein [Armatimonadota bacterium]